MQVTSTQFARNRAVASNGGRGGALLLDTTSATFTGVTLGPQNRVVRDASVLVLSAAAGGGAIAAFVSKATAQVCSADAMHAFLITCLWLLHCRSVRCRR